MTKLKSLIPMLVAGSIALNSCEPHKTIGENTPFTPPIRSQTQQFHLNTPEEFEDSCAFGTISVDLLPSLEVANKECVVAALPNFPSTVYINEENADLNINVCFFDETGVHCETISQYNYIDGISINNSSARIFAISYSATNDLLGLSALQSVLPQIVSGLVQPYFDTKSPVANVSAKES